MGLERGLVEGRGRSQRRNRTYGGSTRVCVSGKGVPGQLGLWVDESGGEGLLGVYLLKNFRVCRVWCRPVLFRYLSPHLK